MPILATEKKLLVLAALLEGNSIRAIERMHGVHRDTIMRLGLAWGEGAQRIHNRLARGLSCPLVLADEIWSYVGKKQARVTAEDSPEVGEAYVFTAMDATSRFIISFHVGKRNQRAHVRAVLRNLRSASDGCRYRRIAGDRGQLWRRDKLRPHDDLDITLMLEVPTGLVDGPRFTLRVRP